MPPTPKISLYSKAAKAKSWVTLIVGSLFSLVLIGFQAAQFLNTLATKEDIENIRAKSYTEIVKTQQELESKLAKYEKLQSRVDEIEEAIVDHLEKHAGRLAAERSVDRKKSARAAEIAREKFRKALAEGNSLKEALSESYLIF
jgi:uncharacterized protein YlxW (UPF0749 family)